MVVMEVEAAAASECDCELFARAEEAYSSFSVIQQPHLEWKQEGHDEVPKPWPPSLHSPNIVISIDHCCHVVTRLTTIPIRGHDELRRSVDQLRGLCVRSTL